MPLLSKIKRNGVSALLTLGACVLMAVGVVTSTGWASPPAGHENPQKVTICHATGSETNPFVKITVDEAAILEAHSEHQDQRDIIPPFTFVDSKGQTTFFAGLNFTAEGQLILANDCKIQAAQSPTPTPTETQSMTPTPTTTTTQPSGAATGTGTVAPAGAAAGTTTAAGAGAGAGAAQGEVSLSAQTAADAPTADNLLPMALFGSGLSLVLAAFLTWLARSRRGQHV